ncbi:MAG TPA: hypothetical protein VIG33_02455 [Pseudobdellovibrionaceae bacterium]|jgi:hypothetical protein
MKDIVFNLAALALMYFAWTTLCKYSHYKQIAEQHYREQDDKFGVQRPVKQETMWDTAVIILQIIGFVSVVILVGTGLVSCVYGHSS